MESNLSELFYGVFEEDKSPVVICDINNTIVYMNPIAAKRYETSGGYALVGKSIMDCHNAKSREIMEKVVSWFKESSDNNRIYTFKNNKENKDVYMIALRNKNRELIGYYEKHEYRSSETASLYDFSKSS